MNAYEMLLLVAVVVVIAVDVYREFKKMKWLDFFFLIIAIVITMTALTQ
ncbi:TPA: hypothetical protein JLN26_002104 [Escherichia coli]|nr:hypothetical protein [Escherichia coli]